MKLSKIQLRQLVESVINEEDENYSSKVLTSYEEAYEKDGITGLILRMGVEGVINVANIGRTYAELDKYKEVYDSQGIKAALKQMSDDGIEFRDEQIAAAIDAGVALK